jgi:raffinose synthase
VHAHVQARLGGGRLREHKPVPDFADLFGWCTWDAFYKDVSAQGVLDGLASFERAGVPPRFVIVDDGWQQWRRTGSGEDRLADMAPNERFGGDLSSLVREAKARFGVRRVLVWHALLGYWGGLDDAVFARYGTRSVARSFGPGLLEQEPRLDTWPWGSRVGVPAREHLAAFYDDLHASLAAQGVDGVKVDVQAVIEAVAAGQGGRVALARATRGALEASVARHFDGRLVNCMSCTSECAYLASDSTLMRTSDDFFPQQPGSHGAHLHCNALASLWFGEFMHPDWDMFQSAHSHGAFHAAARAVSGGPVYVSDPVGVHDAALLRKLVLSDGSVLRADLPGRPSPDVLLADPTRERVLLKIFNRNRDRGVVGLFNAGNGCGDVRGSIGLDDVPVLDATGDFVAWSHQGDRLWRCRDEPRASVTLAEAGWEIVSFAPVEHDFAVLGLADKFNSGGAVSRCDWSGKTCLIELRDGGALLAWADQPPTEVRCDGVALAFAHDSADGRLAIDVPAGGRRHLSVAWR